MTPPTSTASITILPNQKHLEPRKLAVFTGTSIVSTDIKLFPQKKKHREVSYAMSNSPHFTSTSDLNISNRNVLSSYIYFLHSQITPYVPTSTSIAFITTLPNTKLHDYVTSTLNYTIINHYDSLVTQSKD